MNSSHALPVAGESPEPAARTARTSSLWPGITLVAAYWAFVFVLGKMDLPISTSFMSRMGASFLMVLAFVIWWLVNRSVPWNDRLFGFSAFVLFTITAGVLSDPSIGPIGLVYVGLPLAVSVWVVSLLFIRHFGFGLRCLLTVAVFQLVFGGIMLSRVDGVDGSNAATVSPRWSRSAEDEYLSTRFASQPKPPGEAPPADVLTAGDGDWTQFRGPDRQGEQRGVRIVTDWEKSPPKELWRQRIGPAWSSLVVIGDRLFTQEQRGEKEAVVCLDGSTGKEIWSHEDDTRFSDGQAGAGPRATPTFFGGNIYSLGATGILNCVDASSGALRWTRNIVTDSGAPLPMWGFSSSPLIVDDTVVVYAGGPGDKGMLAYKISDGKPAWNIATGAISYSSAQFANPGGQSEVLMLSDTGVVAVDSRSGDEQWRFDAPANGIWRVVQPRQLESGGFLIGSEDLGLVRLDYDPEKKAISERYRTRAIRPAFNDFVVLEGNVYGFDEGIFCCVDIDNGKRHWKGGRYGHGQVLLLVDQKVLVIASEKGEAVLVKATPEKHEELARMQAIHGKTWNHPVVAHGRLTMRNDEEIACFAVEETNDE